MKRILLMGTIFTIVLIGKLFAQDRVVTGKVTSFEDRTPLPGVNVSVKGTTQGTTANADGSYRLSVPNNATLVFSFIGLVSQEVSVGNKTVVDVQMRTDMKQLNEVVVTAFGIQKNPKEVGYSVGKVKSEELIQAKAVNVASALSGKVAGLQINTVSNGVNPSTRIVLRGNRSLLGNNQALIVIDGVQSPQSVLDYLNPNDIESVNVLKGANAAALYGSDAANGALIITTKKGSSGAPRITFSNTSSLESVSFLPEFQNRFGQGTEPYSRTHIPFENQSYGPEFDGSIKPLGRTLEDGTIQSRPYSALPDEKRKIWNTGRTIQNDLSLSAGTKNSTFYISLQDVNIKGVVPKDENRRTGVRVNATTEYGKLQASMNLGYAQTNLNRTTSDFYFLALNTAANVPLSEYKNWQNFKNPDGSLNYANPNNYFNEYYNNPWFNLDNNRENATNGNLTGNFKLSLQATPWLNVAYQLGITDRNYFSKSYTGKFTYSDYAKNVAKIYRAKDITGGVTDLSGFDNRLVQNFLVTANKTFGDFTGTAVLGSNIQDYSTKFQRQQITALAVPEVYNVSNGLGEAIVSEGSTRSRLIGFYGDLSVGYKGFLFLHASGRNDYTSLLPKANRSFFYPEADISFVASEAIPSLKNSGVLSYAKFTASASKVGSVNANPYAIDPIFTPGAGFPYGTSAGFTVGNVLPDPNLKPEFTRTYEVGTELGFFNRINLELAYYTQKTTNQTVYISTSSATGYPQALINAGDTKNEGFEATLNTVVLQSSNGLRWDINVNYSNTNTKVLSLYQGLDEINLSTFYGNSGAADGNAAVFARVGEQYPIVKVTNYKRDPQGRVVVDENGYPLQNPDGLQSAGQTNPRHKLGLSTTIRYKGLSLTALAEYRGGNVIYHDLGNSLVFTGVAKVTEMYGRERFVFPNSVIQNADGSYTQNLDRTVADGGVGYWDNNYKKFGENFITSAAFWKLREVAIRYELPQGLLKSTKYIKSASIGLVGRNLLTLLPKSNQFTDPEFSLNNNNAVGINNTFNTPPTRTYGFNVTLSF